MFRIFLIFPYKYVACNIKHVNQTGKTVALCVLLVYNCGGFRGVAMLTRLRTRATLMQNH